MRQEDRKLSIDVSVKRGAECNTDHQFLCATLRRTWKCPKRKPQKEGNRFDVSELHCASVKEGLPGSVREGYVEKVLERSVQGWPEERSVEEKWKAVKEVLVNAAEETLGRVKGRQPDWFKEAEDTLRPTF